MLRLSKIAITGGMYSGKTTACQILESLGAYLLYSDKITHYILDHNKTCQAELRHLFGDTIFKDGKCDRSKLADLVFADDAKLKALESIVHPLLLEEINSKYEQVRQQSSYIGFYVEIPLVQELNWNNHFDKIVAVTTDETLIFKRMEERMTEKQLAHAKQDYLRRMTHQWQPEKKASHADIQITNNGSIDDLKASLMKQLDL